MTLLHSLMPSGAARSDPTANPDDFSVWLHALPADAKGASARMLIDPLQRVRRIANLRARLRMFDLAFAQLDRLLAPIETELDHTVLPLNGQAQQLMVTASAVLKLLAVGYAKAIEEVSGKWLGVGFAKPMRLALIHAMQLHARRLRLSYRIYARGSKTSWAELHRLYRKARAGGYAAEESIEAGDTAETVYAKALLLAFAEPARFMPGELERVCFYIARHAALAQFVDAAQLETLPKEGCFLLKLRDDQAGRSLRKWSQAAAEPGDLILHCWPLLEKLRDQLKALSARTAPIELGLPLAARRPEYQGMLSSLLRLWSTPPTRRYTRTHFRPRVDVVVGFDELWSFLAGPAFHRRFEDGRRARQAAGLNISEWSISNESPGGFALQLMNGAPSDLRVGELVGIRPREHTTVHVCVTRRVVSSNLANLELGVQKLSPQATAAAISLPPGAGGAPKGSQPLRVLVLTRLPAVRNVPAVVAPSGAIQPHMRIRLPYRGRRITLRVAEPLAKCPSCDIFALVPAA